MMETRWREVGKILFRLTRRNEKIGEKKVIKVIVRERRDDRPIAFVRIVSNEAAPQKKKDI